MLLSIVVVGCQVVTEIRKSLLVVFIKTSRARDFCDFALEKCEFDVDRRRFWAKFACG